MNESTFKLFKRVYVYHDIGGASIEDIKTAMEEKWIVRDCIGQFFHTAKGLKAASAYGKARKQAK